MFISAEYNIFIQTEIQQQPNSEHAEMNEDVLKGQRIITALKQQVLHIAYKNYTLEWARPSCDSYMYFHRGKKQSCTYQGGN